jgi:hypothetical protein
MKRSFAAEDGIAPSLTISVFVDDGVSSVVRVLRDPAFTALMSVPGRV